MLAMVLYPEVQRRARKELNSVLGTERLPEFHDRPSLPYIQAVVNETMRWHPVVPLGTPYTKCVNEPSSVTSQQMSLIGLLEMIRIGNIFSLRVQ